MGSLENFPKSTTLFDSPSKQVSHKTAVTSCARLKKEKKNKQTVHAKDEMRDRTFKNKSKPFRNRSSKELHPRET